MNLAQLGNITPPDTIPTVPIGTESSFVAGLIRNGIWLLLVSSFVIALIFTIIAGLRFVVSGSDEKAVASAWGQIYWGLIGMVIIFSSFAIIKLVETFFGVSIITNFKLTP